MKTTLALAIHFAAAAISEALARRGAVETYSAPVEVARLKAELCFGVDAARGLEPSGEAAAVRTLLSEELAREPSRPLATLIKRLHLDDTERDILTLLLAWAVEPRVGLMFGHVHDALQKTRPSVAALAEVLRDPLAVLVALGPSATLRSTATVELDHSGPDGSSQVDPRLTHYLVTGDLAPLTTTAGRLGQLVIADRLDDSLTARAAQLAGVEVVVVRGALGAGRRRLALALAQSEQRPALLLAIHRLDDPTLPALLNVALRDARLLRARLVVCGPLDDHVARSLAQARDVPLTLVSDPGQRTPAALLERTLANVLLEVPSVQQRTALWATALARSSADPELKTVAARYAFTPGLIRRAARQAATLDLEQAARLQLTHELEGLARCSVNTCGWDRLVVPAATLESLQAICAQARQRTRVGEDWGFSRHHALGQGVKALFYGRPGTGKTLAAEIVAADLDLPLYRIDLSRIVSKWIGETEQNLSRLFDEAEKSQTILFFDEADSLFAKRTSIQNSTDRYANMEVNHLLQRVDSHPGIVILATNLKANLDDAFARRLHFVIDFPEPDIDAREQIWSLSLPPQAPLATDVDFATLARRFEIPGGAIKNAVVGAAYLAAADGQVIQQRHLAAALRREFAKLDRLYQRAELDALLAPPGPPS